MKISQQQFQKMVCSSEAMLRLATRQMVRKEYAYIVEGLPADLLDEMIDNSLAAARAYGLQAPPDLATFVQWCFEFGPEFHRHPAIRAVLTDVGIASEQKIDAVLERVPEEAWRDCEAAMHNMTWFPDLREPPGV